MTTVMKRTSSERVDAICDEIASSYELNKQVATALEVDNGDDVLSMVLWRTTQLWNWIDEQDEPEPLWAIMLERLPFAFANAKSANSILFAYPPGTTFEVD